MLRRCYNMIRIIRLCDIGHILFILTLIFLTKEKFMINVGDIERLSWLIVLHNFISVLVN